MSKTGYDLTLGWAVIDMLPNGTERAVQYAVAGLLVDGSRHKQWCLEKVIESLGVNIADVRSDLDAMEPEHGIAP